MSEISRKGLYPKYSVFRTDASDLPGGRHEGCQLFVLDLTHDPHARVAAATYAGSVSDENSALAADLLTVIKEIEGGI